MLKWISFTVKGTVPVYHVIQVIVRRICNHRTFLVRFRIYLHECVFQKVSNGRMHFELFKKAQSANKFQIEREKSYKTLLCYTWPCQSCTREFRHLIGFHIILLFTRQSKSSILWDVCIYFRLCFSIICLVFALCKLKIALLSANQIQ